MQVNVNIGSNRCDYEFCIFFDEGRCRNKEARRECLEIATAVLCIEGELCDQIVNEPTKRF